MTTDADDTDRGQKLLTYRVGRLEEAVEKAVTEMGDAVKSIEKSFQSFVVLQTQYAATRVSLKKSWSDIDRVSARIQAVEIELPTLKLIRNWVIGGVVGVLGTVGAAVLALVLP